MKTKGYTFIELIIVVSLLATVLLGGTSIFYKNLRSSGLGNVDLSINTEVRSVLSQISKNIMFSTIKSVDSFTRTDCLAGSFVTGNTLAAVDLQGWGTVYSLDSNRIASTAGATAVKVFLTSTASRVTSLQFTWYCQSGVSDKIKIDIQIASAVLGSGFDVTRTVSSEINLLNSGIN